MEPGIKKHPAATQHERLQDDHEYNGRDKVEIARDVVVHGLDNEGWRASGQHGDFARVCPSGRQMFCNGDGRHFREGAGSACKR